MKIIHGPNNGIMPLFVATASPTALASDPQSSSGARALERQDSSSIRLRTDPCAQ